MKYVISAIGNALVDTQYMVDHDFLKDIGLEPDSMTLASAEEHAPIIKKLKEMGEAVSETVAAYEDTVAVLRDVTLSGYTKKGRKDLLEKVLRTPELRYEQTPLALERVLELPLGYADALDRVEERGRRVRRRREHARVLQGRRVPPPARRCEARELVRRRRLPRHLQRHRHHRRRRALAAGGRPRRRWPRAAAPAHVAPRAPRTPASAGRRLRTAASRGTACTARSATRAGTPGTRRTGACGPGAVASRTDTFTVS